MIYAVTNAVLNKCKYLTSVTILTTQIKFVINCIVDLGGAINRYQYAQYETFENTMQTKTKFCGSDLAFLKDNEN